MEYFKQIIFHLKKVRINHFVSLKQTGRQRINCIAKHKINLIIWKSLNLFNLINLDSKHNVMMDYKE